MHQINLKFEGGLIAPCWESIQSIVRSMLKDDSEDSTGKLTRIARVDAGCNYRAPGLYNLEYVPTIGDTVLITLEVVI